LAFSSRHYLLKLFGHTEAKTNSKTMMSAAHFHSRHTGLSHLVEAATALTKLVDTPPPVATKEAPTELQHQSVVSDDDSQAKRKCTSTPAVGEKEIFPQRLMAILSDPSVSDVISWLPHGKSFVILRPDCFERVLTKYFASTDPRSSTKYPSFTRKLNRWGFRQATRGPDTGAFHHPLFRRDQPELCLDMVCQKSRKPRAIKASDGKKAESSSSLPPKKRKVQDPPSTSEEMHSTPRVVSDSSISTSTVSRDDQSVSPSSSSPSQQRKVPISVPLLTALASLPMPAASPATAPIVMNDPDRVAAALRSRAEKERLAIARAMLFDSYVKALNGK
jgi:hypothetical protein